MTMTRTEAPGSPTKGTSRRDFLRRSAVVGGTLVWVAPTVQILDMTAKAAATTSGGYTRGHYPSNFTFIVNLKSIPTGCHGTTTGQNLGFEYIPGTGFVAPQSTNNCLTLTSGNPTFDSTSSFYHQVLYFFNHYPALVKVSQTTTTVAGKTVPAYTLVITNYFFKPAKKSNGTYGPVAYARNGTACTLPSYLSNSPSGYDTYLFPGTAT
jgi:hypothetical protein